MCIEREEARRAVDRAVSIYRGSIEAKLLKLWLAEMEGYDESAKSALYRVLEALDMMRITDPWRDAFDSWLLGDTEPFPGSDA